jgi:hypothetical protein
MSYILFYDLKGVFYHRNFSIDSTILEFQEELTIIYKRFEKKR